MRGPQLYDVIRLKGPIPEHGLASGEVGAIVLTFDRPEEAYEVEFVDNHGQTRALCALTPDQFEVIWSAAAVPEHN